MNDENLQIRTCADYKHRKTCCDVQLTDIKNKKSVCIVRLDEIERL